MSTLVDVGQQVDRFFSLSFEDKKQKVMFMLKEVVTVHVVFADLYTKLSSMPHVWEETLTLLYRWILQIAEKISQKNKQRAGEHRQIAQQMLQALHSQEEKEKADGWDAEEILSFV